MEKRLSVLKQSSQRTKSPEEKVTDHAEITKRRSPSLFTSDRENDQNKDTDDELKLDDLDEEMVRLLFLNFFILHG